MHEHTCGTKLIFFWIISKDLYAFTGIGIVIQCQTEVLSVGEKKGEDRVSVRVPLSLRQKMDRMKEMDPEATDSSLFREGIQLLAKLRMRKGVA